MHALSMRLLGPIGVALVYCAAGCAHGGTAIRSAHTAAPGTSPVPGQVATIQQPLAFAQLRSILRTGQHVVIRIRGGVIKGRVARVSDREIVVARKQSEARVSCEEVERIERPTDPPWEGAIIGGAAAVLPAWNGCQNKGPNRPCVVLGIAVYAAVGALIDWVHGEREILYRAAPGSCTPGAIAFGR